MRKSAICRSDCYPVCCNFLWTDSYSLLVAPLRVVISVSLGRIVQIIAGLPALDVLYRPDDVEKPD